jgi:hypothetical protein
MAEETVQATGFSLDFGRDKPEKSGMMAAGRRVAPNRPLQRGPIKSSRGVTS